MMQYKTQRHKWSEGPEQDGPNDYWKLGSTHVLSCDDIKKKMKGRGFYSRSDARKDRLWDLFHRMQRGLISYEGCFASELVQFIEDRGLTLCASNFDNYKKRLVSTLEQADDVLSFEKFTELPPELRSRIYKAYFEQLVLPLCPTQPPITKVSRLIRNEALPLFYSTCTFRLMVVVRKIYNSTGTWNPIPREIRVLAHSNTSKFFAKTDATNVNRIQNLQVSLFDSEYNRIGWLVEVNDSRDRSKTIRRDEKTAKEFERHKKYHNFDDWLFLRNTTELAEEVVNKVNSRSEMHELLQGDVALFTNALKSIDAKSLARWFR